MSGEQTYLMERLAVPDSLDELHSLLERIGGEHPEVAPADLMMFETAVVEIAGNVIEHGEPTGGVTFSFALTVLPDRLVCLLEDSSSRPVPGMSERVMPDDLDLEDGRGLALAQAALDVMECRQADGLNRWTLVRLRH